MKAKYRATLSLVAVLAALLLSGCGSSPPASSPEPVSPEPTTAVQASAVQETATLSPEPVEVGPEETASSQPPTVVVTTMPAEPTATVEALEAATEGQPWWNETVFYEVFVRSFYDSDGDGIGDLKGLTQRLDYLNDGDPSTTEDLGVTGLWLMPIMQSPSYHGYDVVDYYQVDDEYGTNEDFRRLVEQAHARGMRVIVDLPLNHTSREHPWFQESRDPNSARRDWFVWSEEDPGYAGPQGQRVWHKDDSGYYYGIFGSHMPDLNYENPQVTETMFDVSRFWLEEMGADGFRLDAIKFLIADGSNQQNTPATHAWFEEFYTFYKGIDPNAFTVGEAWTSTQQVLDYTGDEVDVAFQFDLARSLVNSAGIAVGSLFTKEMVAVAESFPPNQYATFITNHDQERVMSQVKGQEGAARVAASVLLTTPGVPFVYYGEEIGQSGTKPDEDIRRPMQWSGDDPGAGFTEGTPWRAPADDYPTRNVAAQEEDLASLLNHYRSLIALRGAHQALQTGDWIPLEADPARLYAYLRSDGPETLLILVNPTDEPVDDYRLNLSAGPLSGEGAAEVLFGEGSAMAPEVNQAGGFTDYKPFGELQPYSTYVIDLSSGP